MTPDERKRMNSICIAIQEETDHDRFVTMLQELSALIAQKEQRRFQQYAPLVWKRDKPWKAVPAMVKKLIKPVFGNPEKVEIALSTADDLFREVRIENTFTDIDGGQVSVSDGAEMVVTFEVETKTATNRNGQGHPSGI
jgi:hypothetical protein